MDAATEPAAALARLHLADDRAGEALKLTEEPAGTLVLVISPKSAGGGRDAFIVE